jgi:sporulation-control protein spo0M
MYFISAVIPCHLRIIYSIYQRGRGYQAYQEEILDSDELERYVSWMRIL